MSQVQVPAGLVRGKTANAEDVVSVFTFLNGRNLDDTNMPVAGVNGSILTPLTVDGGVLKAATVPWSKLTPTPTLAFLGSIVLSGSTVVAVPPGGNNTQVAIQAKSSVHRYYLPSFFLTADVAADVAVIDYFGASAATQGAVFIQRPGPNNVPGVNDVLNMSPGSGYANPITVNYSIYQLSGSAAPPQSGPQHRCLIHADPLGKIVAYTEIEISQFLADGGDIRQLVTFPGVVPEPSLVEIPRRPPWAKALEDVFGHGRIAGGVLVQASAVP